MDIKQSQDAVVASIRAAIRGESSLEAEYGRRASGICTKLLKGLSGVDPINGLRWETDFSAAVQADLEASKLFKDANTLKNRKASYKVAVIGMTNDIVPTEGESLKAYVIRAKPICIERGHYTPSNRGGAKAGAVKSGDQKPGKVVKVTRTAALAALAVDLGDRQVIDFLVRHHMDALRALYTKYAPTKS